MDIIELIGWIGAVLLLIAYTANLLGKVENDSRLFLIINILGAVLLVVNAFANRAYPFVVINSFWFLVSMIQLFSFRSDSIKEES